MSIYYQDEMVTLYHGDWREAAETLVDASVAVTDPPYGVAYNSRRPRETVAASIANDLDTSERDEFLERRVDLPALVFGTWRIPRPANTRAVLVWDTKGALGMGALDLPWKPSHQEIYVIGRGFAGRRGSDVITCAPVQSLGYNGREHPHQKPLDLMRALIDKCPPGAVADPFAGSGSTLVAAKSLGRKSIGAELDERYCEIAAKRLSQGVLDLTGLDA